MRLAAMLGVLAVLLGPSQVLPGLLSLGVALERSHSVEIGFDGTTFRLVLKHEAASHNDVSPQSHAGFLKPHHHGFASRVLCFWGDGAANQPDHAASFTTGSAWNETEAQVTSNSSVARDADLDAPQIRRGGGKILSQRTHSILDHGPPGGSGWRASLRSTVFLI